MAINFLHPKTPQKLIPKRELGEIFHEISGHREPTLYGTLKLKEWLWLPIPFHVSSHCFILDLTKVYFSIYQKTNAIKYMTSGVVGTEERDVTGILENTN